MNGSPRPYLLRVADDALASRLVAMGAVLIEGVKGCGKTETARRAAASEVLLDVDPQAVMKAAIDPGLLLDGPTPRLVDEWQRVPAVWDAVRRSVDRRGLPGQFILTGSATPSADVQRHSGAGRFGVLRMRTMTLAEKQATTPGVSLAGLFAGEQVHAANCTLQLREYLHHIAVGGWPFLVGASEAAAIDFLDGYLDVIVERDMNEVAGGPRNPRLVRRFLHAYAQLVSHPAMVATILRRAHEGDHTSSGPSRNTAEGYLDALSRMMIIDDVPAWDPSVRSSKRLTATPKRHLADPSLAAALLGMSSTRMLDDLLTAGFLFESLVAHDLRIYGAALGATCFHYREAEGRLEVDYVIETREGDWIGIEVKLGEAGVDRAADALLRLAQRVPRPPKALMVVTGGSLAYQRPDGVLVIPLGLLGP